MLHRYFIEISYLGLNYSGLQKQNNAITIEDTLSKALSTYFKNNIFSNLTGASRTDTGVHARKNVFHIDFTNTLTNISKDIYHLNAILPYDIVIRKIYKVKDNINARFDAIERHYKYYIHTQKTPFNQHTSFFFPYKIDMQILHQCAEIILQQKNFLSFCKKHTDNKTPFCHILESTWLQDQDVLIYNVRANRFLRGMVRALVATMLHCGRQKISIQEFKKLFDTPCLSTAYFDVQGCGLFLEDICYDDEKILN